MHRKMRLKMRVTVVERRDCSNTASLRRGGALLVKHCEAHFPDIADLCRHIRLLQARSGSTS
jgi:hypothetical protein